MDGHHFGYKQKFLKKKTFIMAITHRKNHEDHREKDLAKSGYKPSMKYKSLITLLYFG
jgi:hypothetical protein